MTLLGADGWQHGSPTVPLLFSLRVGDLKDTAVHMELRF